MPKLGLINLPYVGRMGTRMAEHSKGRPFVGRMNRAMYRLGGGDPGGMNYARHNFRGYASRHNARQNALLGRGYARAGIAVGGVGAYNMSGRRRRQGIITGGNRFTPSPYGSSGGGMGGYY